MRIISGTHKGKAIQAPKNLPVRPTTDFAKEGLFNIIENNFEIDELDVLDLFAGTGNITYEFASRGAKTVTSIDQNSNCYNFIKRTSKELNLSAVQVFRADVFKFLHNHKNQYDFIFADPPYELKNIPEIAQLVFDNKVLKENGWLVIEHDKRTDFSKHPNFLQHRKYGHVNYSIFQVGSLR